MTGVSTDAPERTGRLRVLCVDDNRDVADSSVVLLQTVGFDARPCYNGKSALLEALTFSPNVFFIDLNMPGMDGDELAIRLQRIPLIGSPLLVALTAQSSEGAQRRIEEAGFHLHLVKPVDPCKLVKVVDAYFLLKHPTALLEFINKYQDH